MVGDESDRVDETKTLETCVVLGGRSFVGRSLVLRLLKLGRWIVRIADSDYDLQLDSSEENSPLDEAIAGGRVSYLRVDVRSESELVHAFEGCSTVFYMGSSTLYSDDFFHCHTIIVQGMKKVISTCQKCKVKRLIYNSNADVVFDGSHDMHDVDESLPCHWKLQDMMSELKAQAEALVLFANNNNGLLTCAIRPCNVFGPDDSHFVPFFLNNARSGWGKFIVGSGENISDFTYVENAAHAHVCADEALCSSTNVVAGKAFFITNLEPVKFWDFVSLISEGVGYQRPFIKVPANMVWCMFALAKWTQEKLNFRKRSDISSAQYFVQIADRTRTFKCSSAQKHLKYSPVVSMEEGIKLTIEAFSHLGIDSPYDRFGDLNEESKVEKMLGNGKVADILLWRQEKETFAYFFGLFFSFCWFVLGGKTFISSAAELLVVVAVILYGHDFLPPNILGFNIQRIHPSTFEVSETVVEDIVTALACMWNRGIYIAKEVAKGEDWNTFLKVAICLFVLKTILSCSFSLVICGALAFPFTVFFIYEQYEDTIDESLKVLVLAFQNLKEPLARNLPVAVAKMIRISDVSNPNEGSTTVGDHNTAVPITG